MALSVSGIVTSRGSQEHGKPALACCLHPKRQTLFLVAGQCVDEYDALDGMHLHRIISDLPDPIVRLEVSVSDRGSEYLLLLSSNNDLRIWDIENRFHLAAVSLAGSNSAQRRALATLAAQNSNTLSGAAAAALAAANSGSAGGVSSMCATQFHSRCTLIFARLGSGVLECLHLQRQLEHPGSTTLIDVLETKAVTAIPGATSGGGAAAVTAIAAHSKSTLVAAGTADGTVTVFYAPFMSELPTLPKFLASGDSDSTSSSNLSGSTPNRNSARGATSPIPASVSGTLASTLSSSFSSSTSSSNSYSAASSSTQSHQSSVVLFAAAINPDLAIVQGKLRRGGEGSLSYDFCSTLAFHPTLPLLAAADGNGRIVVFRVGGFSDLEGESGGVPVHATIASRDWTAPNTPSESPRIITTLTFHPTLPRLTSLAYCPQEPYLAPLVQAWCTAHSSLPPLQSPMTPGLAAAMVQAVQAPYAQAVAAFAQPPYMLTQPSATGIRSPVIWLGGTAIVTSEITSSSALVGVLADDASYSQDGFGSAWESGPDSTLLRPLVPMQGTGIAYAGPVCDVMTSPRSWFVTGGEGEGVDIGAEDSGEKKNEGSGLDDPLNGTGSLAEFAARLTKMNKSTTTGGKDSTANCDSATGSLVTDTKTGLGLKNRKRIFSETELKSLQEGVSAVVYVQTRTDAVAAPPRIAIQHSLHVRELGSQPLASAVSAYTATASSSLSSSSTMSSSSSTASSLNLLKDSPSSPSENSAAFKSKRICWLPSYGPGGPLLPISVQKSPSGRFFIVRFAYVTELAPNHAAKAAFLDSLAEAEAAASVDVAAQQNMLGRGAKGKDEASMAAARNAFIDGRVRPVPIDLTSGGSSGSIRFDGASTEQNVTGTESPDLTMYVLVGPVDCDSDATSGEPLRPTDGLLASGSSSGCGVSYKRIRTDVSVSALRYAVDVSFLAGDRLLLVRRPLIPPSVAGSIRIRSTAYNVSIQQLAFDWEADDRVQRVRARERQARERHEAEMKRRKAVEEEFMALDAADVAAAKADHGSLLSGMFKGAGVKEKAERERELKKEEREKAAAERQRKLRESEEAIAAKREKERHAVALEAAKDLPLRVDPYRVPVDFAIHDPIVRAFATPFKCPVPPRSTTASGALVFDDTDDEQAATAAFSMAAAAAAMAASDDSEAELGVSGGDAATSVPLPFLPPGARTAPAASVEPSGDVILYCTRYRSSAADSSLESDANQIGEDGNVSGERMVLRYSNNAFGTYDVRNPHGYAIVDAYEPAFFSRSFYRSTHGSIAQSGGAGTGKPPPAGGRRGSQHAHLPTFDEGILSLKKIGEVDAKRAEGESETHSLSSGNDDAAGAHDSIKKHDSGKGNRRSRGSSFLSFEKEKAHSGGLSLSGATHDDSYASAKIPVDIISDPAPGGVVSGEDETQLPSDALRKATLKPFAMTTAEVVKQLAEQRVPQRPVLLRMPPAEAWNEHSESACMCPIAIRPALMLSAGELVLKVTWQSDDHVWADAGSHDDSEEKENWVATTTKQMASKVPVKVFGSTISPTSPGAAISGASGGATEAAPSVDVNVSIHVTRKVIARRLTLPLAIAQGGPLLSILTTHRLIIATPALQMLAAVPVLPTLGGSTGFGLSHASSSTPGNSSSVGSSSLHCPMFGVFRGIFAPPQGFGAGFGPSSSASEGVTNVTSKSLTLQDGYIGALNSQAIAPAFTLSSALGLVDGKGQTKGGSDQSSDDPLPVASPTFGPPVSGLAPVDGSGSRSGGFLTGTASAAAAGASRLTSPLPASRLTDTLAQDDISDEVLSGIPWRTTVTSHCWAGPALMLTTSSGEVFYMTPTGRLRRSCALLPDAKDSVLVAALPDRLVFAGSHWQTGRILIKSRAFSPLEPLLASTLDAAMTRPKPDYNLLAEHASIDLNEQSSSSFAIRNSFGQPPPHPIVSALASTLTVGLAINSPAVPSQSSLAGDKSSRKSTSTLSSSSSSGNSTKVKTVYLTGSAAVSGAALAALARDYSFARDLVTRYAHPKRVAGGSGTSAVLFKEDVHSAWGVSRVVIASLEERGLLDLAFFAAQGDPRCEDKGEDPYSAAVLKNSNAPGGSGGAFSSHADGDEDDEAGDNALSEGARRWLDETGNRRKAFSVPWSWRASLALKRGRFDQALLSLLSEDPSLASAISALVRAKNLTATALLLSKNEAKRVQLERREKLSSGGEIDDDNGTYLDSTDAIPDVDLNGVKLPSPSSPFASRLKVLGEFCVNAGNIRAAVLCFDLAGDHAAAFRALAVSAKLATLSSAKWKDPSSRVHRFKDGSAGVIVPSISALNGAIAGVEGSLTAHEVDAALSALVLPNRSRYPSTAIFAALTRKSMAENADKLDRKMSERKKKFIEERRKERLSDVSHLNDDDDDDDDEEEEDDDDDRKDYDSSPSSSRSVSLLDSIRVRPFAPAIGTRNDRPSDQLLSLNYAIGSTIGKKSFEKLSTTPYFAQSPFLPLVDPLIHSLVEKAGEAAMTKVAIDSSKKEATIAATAAAATAASSTQVRTSAMTPSRSSSSLSVASTSSASSSSSSAALSGLHNIKADVMIKIAVPSPSCSMHTSLHLAGSTFSPPPSERLPPILHAPLSLDTINRFIGVVLTQVALGVAAAQSAVSSSVSATEDGGDEEEGAAAGSALADIIGAMSGGGSKGDEAAEAFEKALSMPGSPEAYEYAVLAAKGKKKLKALPRGAEDAVLGYWRFERSDQEATAEKAAAVKNSSNPWGLKDDVSGEALSVWSHTVMDLSKQQSHGFLFDSLLMIARTKGIKAAIDAAADAGCTLSSTSSVKGAPEAAMCVRIGLSITQGGCPCDPGDGVKVREPRALIAGVNVPQPTEGASQRPLDLRKYIGGELTTIQADKGLGSTIPPSPVSASLKLLSTSVPWGVAVPVRRFSYLDVGLRQFDTVNSQFTFEAWICPSSSTPMVALPIVKRLERCQTSPSVVELKTQWMLSVTAEGSLTFDAFPDGAFASGEESDDSPRSPKSPESRPSTRISTAAGTIPFGEWRHVALVVDASAAAKESAIRLKSAAVTAGTNSTSSLSSPPPLPSARVRLFIDGEAADDAEGDIGCLMPLPIIDDRLDTHDGSAATSPSAALTTDFLVLAPGFVGRLGEVRLWSKKKSSNEISEAKDFHLDMAESKRGKMTIQIRAAAAPVPSSATGSVLPPSASLSANTNGAEGSIAQTALTLSAEASSSSTASVTSSVASSSSSLPLPLPPTIKKLGAPLGGLGGGSGGGLAAPPSGVSSKRKVLAATSTTASVPTSTAPPPLGKTSSTFDDDFASGFSSSTLSSSSSSLSSESTSIEQQQQQHSSSTPSVSSSISNDSDFDSTPVPTIKKPFGGLSKPGGGLSAPPPPAASSKKKAMMAKSKTVEGGT
jgi:hypothetical protein